MTLKLGQATGPERHVLRDRPGLGAVGRRARRRRSDDAGGAQLRPRAPLQARSWSTPSSASSAPSTCTTRGRSRAPASRTTSWASCTASRMGCDACYTNHADADQNDLENLEVLLATAGCNFFMGLPMGDDVMLNYQSTSLPRRRDAAPAASASGPRPSSRRGWRRWASCATASSPRAPATRASSRSFRLRLGVRVADEGEEVVGRQRAAASVPSSTPATSARLSACSARICSSIVPRATSR